VFYTPVSERAERVARMKNDPDFAATMLVNLKLNNHLYGCNPNDYIDTTGSAQETATGRWNSTSTQIQTRQSSRFATSSS
jgi:hypothetical protein